CWNSARHRPKRRSHAPLPPIRRRPSTATNGPSHWRVSASASKRSHRSSCACCRPRTTPVTARGAMLGRPPPPRLATPALGAVGRPNATLVPPAAAERAERAGRSFRFFRRLSPLGQSLLDLRYSPPQGDQDDSDAFAPFESFPASGPIHQQPLAHLE